MSLIDHLGRNLGNASGVREYITRGFVYDTDDEGGTSFENDDSGPAVELVGLRDYLASLFNMLPSMTERERDQAKAAIMEVLL